MQAATKKHRRTFLIIFALFFGPIVIATLLAYSGVRFEGTDHVNKGTLIQPARQVTDIALLDAQKNAMDMKSLDHRWGLLYVSPGQCEATCISHMAMVTHLHAMLAKDRARVRRYVVLPASTASWDALFTNNPKSFAAAHVVFQGRGAKMSLTPDHVYIIDPLGNLMLDYDEHAREADILKDLMRMLKYSKIG